jgi:hypothetical protein
LEVVPVTGRPVFHLLFVLLFVGTAASGAKAWQLTIQSAVLDSRYVYASQSGPRGFFGPYNIDLGTAAGDLASLNGWFRKRMVSGTTAEVAQTQLIVFPDLILNNAVALHGTYQLGPFNTETDRTLTDQESETVLPDGRWTRLWITVNTPVGMIYYGKRGFQQGCGLQFGSGRTAEEVLDSDRRTEEIVQLETFFGPLTLGAGFYPWRRGSRRFWNLEDHNAARNVHVLAYARYLAGKVDAGLGGFYWAFDDGPEAQRTTKARVAAPPSSTTGTEGWLYVKYHSGRVFLNAEADWYYRTVRYQSSQDGTFFGEPAIPFVGGGSLFAPAFIESWRYMLEFGGLAGPAKLSFLLTHIPGPDKRHGILIRNQPYIQEPEESAYGVFYPYCLFMAKYYGAGINSYRDMSAADVLAGQLSYMLASNLDLYSSIMYARRSSQGFGYGYVVPTRLRQSGEPVTDPAVYGVLNFAERGSFDKPSPTIPDSDLGWEFNVGVSWRLLENWLLQMRGAYWQPGRWFNYAFIDKSVPGWTVPSPANDFGVNPYRTVDPVVGLELRIQARL